MFDVLIQMAALIICGVAWRIWRPLGIDADTCRRSLTATVYILLLPALVLEVLWQAPLGWDSGRIALSATVSVLISLALAALAYKLGRTEKTIAGALILAAAFPNATYMGLPVLEKLLGTEARSIAIQFDLFACTPLLLTVGIMLASSYGNSNKNARPLAALFSVPALWAAIIAVALNLSDTPMPALLNHWLGMLSGAVIPLMLISLGMGLQWSSWRASYFPLLFPVIALQLLVMPMVALFIGQWLGLEGDLLTGVVLEAAMPSMVLGLVLCDRYGLNASLYAIAVTVTTALTMFSIPLWFNWAS